MDQYYILLEFRNLNLIDVTIHDVYHNIVDIRLF
jgi:hypothetical protein